MTLEVKLIDLSRPDGDLLGSSRTAAVLPAPSLQGSRAPFGCNWFWGDVMVTGDGKSYVCGGSGTSDAQLPKLYCLEQPTWNTLGFAAISLDREADRHSVGVPDRLPRQRHGLRRLAWSKLAAESGLSRPTPLTCAPDLQVVVSADGTVVCGGYGILRAYTPNPLAKTCPAVPDWASVGFVTYSTVTGKQAGTPFQYDTNCQPGNVGVLWTSAAGDRVIGYYSLGSFFATKPLFRFGVFSHDRYTPLPLPPTTTTVPATIAW